MKTILALSAIVATTLIASPVFAQHGHCHNNAPRYQPRGHCAPDYYGPRPCYGNMPRYEIYPQFQETYVYEACPYEARRNFGNPQFGAVPVQNGQFQNGQLQGGQIQGGQFPNGQFQGGQVPDGQFQNGQVQGGQFGHFQNGQFQGGQVPNGQFQGGQIQGGQFQNGQFQNGLNGQAFPSGQTQAPVQMGNQLPLDLNSGSGGVQTPGYFPQGAPQAAPQFGQQPVR